MASLKYRRGITIIEMLFALTFLFLVLAVATSPVHRVVDIFRSLGGEDRFGEMGTTVIALVTFAFVCFFWFAAVRIIARLRLRFNEMLYFPLLAGPSIGFAIVPFRSIPFPAYPFAVICSIIVLSVFLFLLQSAVLLVFGLLSAPKHHPLPDSLPPISEEEKAKRTKLMTKVEDYPPHPNLTPDFVNYFNDVCIHGIQAREAFLYDGDEKEFRHRYSIYSRNYLKMLILKSDLKRDCYRDMAHQLTADRLLEPFAALDFEAAHDWAKFTRRMLHDHCYICIRSRHLSRESRNLMLVKW